MSQKLSLSKTLSSVSKAVTGYSLKTNAAGAVETHVETWHFLQKACLDNASSIWREHRAGIS